MPLQLIYELQKRCDATSPFSNHTKRQYQATLMIRLNLFTARFDLLQPIRQRLDAIEIQNPRLAHALCKLIPAQCPFARTVSLFGRTVFTIPPLCKLNPLYEQIADLRFRALTYLADVCGENIMCYL